MAVLLVIVPDAISAILAKGEYPPRYYNPGNLFDEVHILMCNDDKPDARELQMTVGTARLFLHNLPEEKQFFIQYARWFRPWLLKRWGKLPLALVQRYQIHLLEKWSRPAVELARQIRPDIVRCHGHQTNIFVASHIKRVLGIPYVVSLHGNPDLDYFRGRLGVTDDLRLLGNLFLPIELIGLRNADYVVAVYSAIMPFLDQHKIGNALLIYNFVGVGGKKKDDYKIDKKNVNCICVNRQARLEKDPTQIIDAVIEMPNVHLLLIGDGDLHQDLVDHVGQNNATDRIHFIRSLPNSEVLLQMNKADIFVYTSVISGLSKGCIEAALTGLPVVLKGGEDLLSTEFLGEHFLVVDGTKESYKQALIRLIEDDVFREQLGCKAFAYAREHWAPEKIESQYVEIYKAVMAK